MALPGLIKLPSDSLLAQDEPLHPGLAQECSLCFDNHESLLGGGAPWGLENRVPLCTPFSFLPFSDCLESF
jgi:hypothetical protein